MPPETLKIKQFAGKALSVDLDKRTVRHFITTTAIDDDGEVLLPRGADLSRFLKSGTVFDVHEYRTKDIIGQNVDLKVTDKGIIATTKFAERPPSLPKEVEWFPDTSLWLHHTGDINGWSVGLDPTETRPPNSKDREEFGHDKSFKTVVSRWKMLEYSQAPIPTNEDARNLAIKAGRISPRLARIVAGGTVPNLSELKDLTSPRPLPVVMVIAIPPAPRRKRRGPTTREITKRVEQAISDSIARRKGKIHA